MCDASKNTNNMNVFVFDEMSDFNQRKILETPDKYRVLSRKELEKIDHTQINEKYCGMSIIIQLQSGWMVNGLCEGIEGGDCIHH